MRIASMIKECRAGTELGICCPLRVFGGRLAELPFIATRDGYRREGNCKRLIKVLHLHQSFLLWFSYARVRRWHLQAVHQGAACLQLRARRLLAAKGHRASQPVLTCNGTQLLLLLLIFASPTTAGVPCSMWPHYA
jgi:hypothetical protein